MATYSVQILARSAEALRALGRYDLDLRCRNAAQLEDDLFLVPGLATADEIRLLEAGGYAVTVMADLDEVARERAADVARGDRFADGRSLDEFAERTVQGYLTPAEVVSALQQARLQFPDLVTLIPLPHRTWEGRQSLAARLRAGNGAGRPGLLVTGSLHAREWGGADTCISLLIRLLNAYRHRRELTFGGKTFTAAQVRTLLETVDLFLFPEVNPDGKGYSQSNMPATTWWRKNRNPNGGAAGAAMGVDLNRNFDFLWGSGIGTSADLTSPTYKGAAPFSEPETRNIRWLLDTYPGIRYYVDIHSYGGLILYSWGDDDNQSTDPGQTFRNPAYNGRRGVRDDALYREFISTLDLNTAVGLANRMNAALTAVRGRPYAVRQAVGLYPTSGTSDDYAFSRHITQPGRGKVYAFTVEFGEEFIPPFAEMERIMEEVSAAVLELGLAATGDAFLRDSPADVGAVPVAPPFWASPDLWVRNRDDGGAAHQNTIRGRDNFVYVRVHNRGRTDVVNAKVRVCLANFAGTQFTYPGDWIPRNPAGGGVLNGPGTYLIGEKPVPAVVPGGSQVVSLRWAAGLIPPAPNWHPCLLAEVAPDDGPPALGARVWESNSLAQKNISIVNARRGETVELPFRVGSPFTPGVQGELTVEVLQAPTKAKVLLDLKSPLLLDKLLALATVPVAHGLPVTATLLRPVTVAVGPGGRDELVCRLPAETRVTLPSAPAGPLAGDDRAPGPVGLTGLAAEPAAGGAVLALTGAKPGRLPLRLPEPAPMSLRVVVPEDAGPGDQYRFQVVQLDARKQPVGGVLLEVNVTE